MYMRWKDCSFLLNKPYLKRKGPLGVACRFFIASNAAYGSFISAEAGHQQMQMTWTDEAEPARKSNYVRP